MNIIFCHIRKMQLGKCQMLCTYPYVFTNVASCANRGRPITQIKIYAVKQWIVYINKTQLINIMFCSCDPRTN